MTAHGHHVVLDTNAWIGTPLLGVPLGAAFVFHARHAGRRLALPEVVERELFKQTARVVAESVRKIESEFDRIARFMGFRDDYRVPSPSDVERRVRDRFLALDDIVDRYPATEELMRRALTRVIAGDPPNEHEEQFRDSLIWETVVELSKQAPVDLISGDREFYEARQLNNALSSALRREVSANSGEIRLFQDVRAYLAGVEGETPPLDSEDIGERLARVLRTEVAELGRQRGFQIGEHYGSRITVYVTERDNKLALSFNLDFAATDQDLATAEIMSPSDTVEVGGSCYLDHRTREVEGVLLETIEYFGPDGDIVPGRGMKAVYPGTAVLGGRSIVQYEFRERLRLWPRSS